MNIEQIMRFGFTLAVWAIVAVLMTLGGILNLFFNLSAFVSFLIIGLGVVGTMIIWNQNAWEQMRQGGLIELEAKITQELQKMNKKDMLEMADGLRQIREKFGIELDLPLNDKQKYELDGMLSRLSEEELSDVQQRLRSGALSEEDLAEWLQASHKVMRG
jgi:hypothetical protein